MKLPSKIVDISTMVMSRQRPISHTNLIASLAIDAGQIDPADPISS